MYVYVVTLFLAMCSWVDVELPEEPQYQYPEHLSSKLFEQQEQFEEGKYNMNNTYHFKYIFILYAYKDFPSPFISFIYILGLHFG